MRVGFFSTTMFRVTVLVAVVGGFIAYVYFEAGMPPPDEANRTQAVDRSFSIIHPPDWTSSAGGGGAGSKYRAAISAEPQKMIGQIEQFSAREFKDPANTNDLSLTGFSSISFQNQPAWGNAIQETRNFNYRLIFQRGSRWFEIFLRLQRPEEIPGSTWWRYFESFNIGIAPPSSQSGLPE